MLKTRNVVMLGIATIATLLSGYSRTRAIHPHNPMAGFYCATHRPVHFAKTAADVPRYTDKYNCSGWSAASTGTVFGKVILGATSVAGVQVTLQDGDGTVLGTATTNSEGAFALRDVPRRGQYEIQVRLIGLQPNRTIVDVANENLVLRIPVEQPDL